MDLKEKDKTIVGYVLLIIGLILMFYSITTVIGVFSGGEVPIEILHSEAEEKTTETNPENGNETMPEIDLAEIVEPMFPMFNLMAWIIIAFFILIAGGRVARVGIQMMKASLPDVKIIKQDMRDIKDSYKEIENNRPVKKEKKGFFKGKSNE